MTLKAFASSSLHFTSPDSTAAHILDPNPNPNIPLFRTHYLILSDSFAVRVSAKVYVTPLFMLLIFTYSSGTAGRH